MKSKVKILHVTGDAVGGIRKHIHDIIYYLNDKFDFYFISSNKEDKISILESEEIINLVKKRIRFCIFKKPNFNDISNIYRIYRLIRTEKIDIVHGHGAKGGVYARVAGRLAGIKVIYTPHGGSAHNMFTGFEGFIYKKLEQFLVPITDYFIFESNYTKDAYFKKINSYERDNFFVNYNGVDVQKIVQSSLSNEKITSNEIKIGFFGVLRHEKGILFSIDVMEEILQEFDVSYHIYGDGPLLEEVKNKISSSSYSTKMFLHGETSNPYSKMLNMDIIFVPSFFESFGYVAVESMILEKTLVFSSAGALPEVCSFNSEFMFEFSSINDASQKLTDAILTFGGKDNVGRLKVVSDMATNKYSINGMLNGIENVYNDI